MPDPLQITHCDEPVLLRRGSLYLSRELCDRYFKDLNTVVLIRIEEWVNILPGRCATSDGYVLKRRNPRGDRVINAPDFFRAQGFAEVPAVLFDARWNAELYGLTLKLALASVAPAPPQR